MIVCWWHREIVEKEMEALRSRLTRACLKHIEKHPSDSDELIVIGLMSTAKHDLRRLVGMVSRSHDENQRKTDSISDLVLKSWSDYRGSGGMFGA